MDNCCCSATEKCTKFVREFLYAQNLITDSTQLKACVLFFAELSIYFPGTMTPRTPRSRGLIWREKKRKAGRRVRERKKDRMSAPLAVYNSLSMKALTSCPYFSFPLRDAIWKSAFLADFSASPRYSCASVSSTAQCFAIFNWLKKMCLTPITNKSLIFLIEKRCIPRKSDGLALAVISRERAR